MLLGISFYIYFVNIKPMNAPISTNAETTKRITASFFFINWGRFFFVTSLRLGILFCFFAILHLLFRVFYILANICAFVNNSYKSKAEQVQITKMQPEALINA